MATLAKLSRLEEEISELRRLEQEIPQLRGPKRKEAFKTYRELILWLLKDEPVYLARYE
jgi:hypothetical protein